MRGRAEIAQSTRMRHRHLLLHTARGCAPWLAASSSSELRRLSTQRLPAGVALGGRCPMQMRGCGQRRSLGPRKRGEARYKKSTEDISPRTIAKAPETRVRAAALAAPRAATSETTAAGARAGRGPGAGTLRARRGSARRSRGPLPGAHSQLLRSVSASRFLGRLRS